LVDTAKALLKTDNIALYMNRILVKDRTWSEQVEVHQDMPYFHGGIEKISFFLPLTPQSPRRNGGMVFLKGSHLYGQIQPGTIMLKNFPPLEEFAPDLDIGDLLIVNFLNWHFSPKSIEPTDRMIMQVVYQPATDGSYGGIGLGVAEPTLVCGKWETKHYTCRGNITLPDR
jgi:hypothetical protein